MASFFERVSDGLAERYAVQHELGMGGMAVVYLARDLKHDRNVAVKVLRPEIGLALGTERFLQEIKTTARLSHPHILPLLDSGETDGLLYYVMPLVEGETLRERLERERQLSYDDALQIVLEVGDALSYAHSRDVLHRDIKPENIMLESGHAIIADFGIARAISNAGTERLTQTGLVVGTPAYMSPEQAGGDEKLDGRSDVYSLAAVFYEMLVGASPYSAPTPQAIMMRQLSEEVPRISEERDTVPPVVDNAVRKALAKLPADRYATIQQFMETLQDTGRTAASTVVLDTKRRSKLSKKTWIAAAVVVASIVGAAALYSASGVEFDERDWVLIADFENRTGDSVFNESLNTALTVGLQQSQHLNVFPDVRIAETLRRMGREGAETIDQATGLEVALRENLRVVVVPTITSVDSIYDLTTRIVDPATGSDLKSRSVRAAGKASVLQALDELSRKLRRDLGESMFSLARRDVQLEAATTPSLEALQAWSEGRFHFGQRRFEEAETLYRRALELDSGFALAHKDLGTVFYYYDNRPEGDFHFERALSLSDSITERERLWVRAEIHNWRAEREAAIDAYNVFLTRYPDDRSGWFRLGYALMIEQRHDEAAAAFERVLSLDSLNAGAWVNLATVQNQQARNDEALLSYRKAFEINPDWIVSGNLNHEFGFNFAHMGQPDSARAVFELMFDKSDAQQAQGRRSLGLLELHLGNYHDGIQQLRQSVILYRTLGSTVSELRSRLFLANAYRAIGRDAEFRTHLSRVRELARDDGVQPLWLARVGKAHVRAGLSEEARNILQHSVERANNESPSDRAAVAFLSGEIALVDGQFIEAGEQFEMAYALQSNSYYLESLARGLFASGDYEGAEAKYAELSSSRQLGWEAQGPWILSFYHLGRAREEMGDLDGAAVAFSQFIDIWQHGDEELIALADARSRLQQISGEP